MNALKCEMCGSPNLVKDGGVFVCQNCGTKYSVEEAKKMLGTVRVDNSEKLENLYSLARRARDNNDSENAQKYYEMIAIEDPQNWEPSFYSIYYRSMNCKIGQIKSAALDVYNCLDSTFKLIKNNERQEKQKDAVQEVANRVNYISTMLFNAAFNHYNGIDINIRSNYTSEMQDRCIFSAATPKNCGDHIVSTFDDNEDICKIASDCYKVAMSLYSKMKNYLNTDNVKKEFDRMMEVVKKYDSSYTPPSIEKTASGGCYVATCVYGSYDCPEVWVLRRYRDDYLANMWYGRAFIKTYYAVSPTIVKLFGEATWFRKMWKPVLDKRINQLITHGYSTKPYKDKTW